MPGCLGQNTCLPWHFNDASICAHGRLWITGEFVNRLIVAILVISTASLNAEGQRQSVAKLKAGARNLVGIIGGDKAKTQAYCQILDLTAQLDRANQEKDSRKMKALSQKMDQLQKQLGPEFVGLVKGLNRIDLNSPDGREILSIIKTLDQSCPD
jgi:hypothetical protein